MIGHNRLRLTFTLVTCLTFLSRGFVIDKRFASQDVRNLNRLNSYDDEDYEDDLLRNTYYYDHAMDAINSNKREFSPIKLRQQVRDRMESIIRGKDASSFLDDGIESEMFDSMMRKMIKDKQEAMKNVGSLKTSSKFLEEKSSQTKIQSNGNEGVAVVTGQSMESSSSGNGSSPLVKVAKVVAVATKDGKDNGEWKMQPIEEEVQVMTPAPEDGKQGQKKTDDDDDDEDRFKSLFERDNGGLFGGRDFDHLFGAKELERSPRIKRSIVGDEEAAKKSANDVDLLKNYIALQDAENRHLMQALDLASEIELNNENDPSTIDEQMYHMRKALEDERTLSAIRKQIQLSIKHSGAKRSPYLFEQDDYPAEDMQKYVAGGDDDDDYINGVDHSYLERYSKRRGIDVEDANDDDDDMEDRDSEKEDEDANLMEEWAGDITLDRHKLKNEELIDRLKEMMSQSDEGWKSISRSKKPHPVDLSSDGELLDEESLRNLLRSYRKNYKTLNNDQDYPIIFPDGDDDYDVDAISPQLRRKILENMARHSISDYRLNPFFRNITKMEYPEKRFFQENRPMVSSSDEDVENTEPWCSKAAKLVDNCLYARLNGLLPDSEAVDLCNAHQLCYKCGSSNGVTSEECDRAFMERSKELCLDEMACKKQAASLYVTMMADRQFYTEFEAPDVCTDPCVTSILYTDRSD